MQLVAAPPRFLGQIFGTGNLRGIFDLPVYFTYTPQLLFAADAAIVFLNLLGLGLLIAVLMRDTNRPFPIISAMVAAGLLLKTLAAVTLFDSPGPLVWLTPGVALGLGLGMLLLYPLIRMPQIASLIAALLCLGAAVAVINFAPDNPYQSIPPKLIPGGTTQLLRFSTIVRALSELWPFLAVGYLIAAAGSLAQALPRGRL